MLSRHSAVLVYLLMGLVLATAPSAQRADSDLVAGGPVTQTLELAPGPNLVSLYVLPGDPTVAKLLAGLGDNLRSIKDPGGPQGASVYAPAQGVRDLETWDWQTAYVVDVKRAARLDIRGVPIAPSSPVVIEPGWNYVPFLHDTPLPADVALASISESVDWGGSGGPFASVGMPSGVVLQPGRGYRLYATRPDTLRYSGTTPPVSNADYSASTLDEALRLRGLQPGQTVRVAGYYAPGDGGGGLFRVTESARTPDGGLVHVPLEHQSAAIDDVITYTDVSRLPSVPDGQDVVFGSLSLTVVNGSDGSSVVIPGHHLHGHRYALRFPISPVITYDGGVYRDARDDIKRLAGTSPRGTLTFSYRHTTSPIRLERQVVASTLNAHWFGARPAEDGPSWTGSTDVQPILAHMSNLAATLNAASPGSITDLVLPAPAVYDYFGTIELADGLTLRGAGGTWTVEVTNDLGHRYRPVRVRPIHTRLRVMSGEALKHIRMEKAQGDPAYLTPDLKHLLQTRITTIAPVDGAASAGMADLVLDGNWEANREAWTEGWASHDELETHLRNSPGWAGFVATNHNGKEIPQGQRITVRNVAVLGYGSNGLLGHANNTWAVDNFLGGNSLWNHVIYNANGQYTNLTLTGFAWGHAAWGYGAITNLVYEGGARSPERQAATVVGIRGGDAYDPGELAGSDGYFTRSDGTVPTDLGTEINGFYMDLRDSGLSSAFRGLGPNVRIGGASAAEPGRLIADPEVSASGLYRESGNGYQKALYPNNRFEHVVLHDLHRGAEHRQSLMGKLSMTESLVRDVRVERGGTRANRSLTLAAGRRDHASWDLPQVVLYDQIVDGPAQFIARIDAARPDAAGMDVFIKDSRFDNQTSTLYSGRSGTGELSKFDGDLSKLRVYMDNVSFNMFGSYLQNVELFFATTRFRNCTDARSGRTSESTLTLQSGDFSGREAIVPLRLFWAPLDRAYVTFAGAGASAVASWEITDAEGAPLGEDKRDPHLRVRLSESLGGRELRVAAAVRPWEIAVRVPPALGL